MRINEPTPNLIAAVRKLLGETPGNSDACAACTGAKDENIQAALWAVREPVRYERLCSITSYLPGGQAERREWVSEDGGAIGDGYQLLDGSYTPIPKTGDTSDVEEADAIEASWLLKTSRGTVYLLGNRYDIHAAAASVVEGLIASGAELYVNTSELGNRTDQAETVKTLQAVARSLWQRARVRTIEFGRSDT